MAREPATGTTVNVEDGNLTFGSTDNAEQAGCIAIYSMGQMTKVGLRNGCAECKVAVINFIYYNGRNEVKRFRMQPYSEQEMDITGTSVAQIIGEDPC